jgi:hypothetical protein
MSTSMRNTVWFTILQVPGLMVSAFVAGIPVAEGGQGQEHLPDLLPQAASAGAFRWSSRRPRPLTGPAGSRSSSR